MKSSLVLLHVIHKRRLPATFVGVIAVWLRAHPGHTSHISLLVRDQIIMEKFLANGAQCLFQLG